MIRWWMPRLAALAIGAGLVFLAVKEIVTKVRGR